MCWVKTPVVRGMAGNSSRDFSQGRKGEALAPPLPGPHNCPHLLRPAQSRAFGTVQAARRKKGEAAPAAGLKPRPSGPRVKTEKRAEKSRLAAHAAQELRNSALLKQA